MKHGTSLSYHKPDPQGWFNARGLILLALLSLFLTIDRLARHRFRLADYEGPWGDVAVAATVAFAGTVLISCMVALVLAVRGKLRKTDRGGVLVLAVGCGFVLVRLSSALRFVYPEYF